MAATLDTATLSAFAKKAGVSLVKCDPLEWGGSIGYKEKDAPNCTVCGFRSENEAYEHWLENTFGNNVGKAVLAFLKKAE